MRSFHLQSSWAVTLREGTWDLSSLNGKHLQWVNCPSRLWALSRDPLRLFFLLSKLYCSTSTPKQEGGCVCFGRFLLRQNGEQRMFDSCPPHASKHTHCWGFPVSFLNFLRKEAQTSRGFKQLFLLLRHFTGMCRCLSEVALPCVCFDTCSLVFTHRSDSKRY